MDVQKKLDIPQLCEFGFIPDHMVEIYDRVTNEYIPRILSTINPKIYVVIGGRAINVYSKRSVKSSDWDIIFNFYKEEALKEVVNYIINILLRDNIQTQTKRVNFGNDHVMFRIGIEDPYIDTTYWIMDLHTNDQPSSIFSESNEINGISYASKKFIYTQLKETLNDRGGIYQRTLTRYLDDFTHDLNKLRDRIYNEIEKIGSSKNDQRKLKETLDDLFTTYSSGATEGLRYQSLVFREGLKALKTRDRYVSFSNDESIEL